MRIVDKLGIISFASSLFNKNGKTKFKLFLRYFTVSIFDETNCFPLILIISYFY